VNELPSGYDAWKLASPPEYNEEYPSNEDEDAYFDDELDPKEPAECPNCQRMPAGTFIDAHAAGGRIKFRWHCEECNKDWLDDSRFGKS